MNIFVVAATADAFAAAAAWAEINHPAALCGAFARRAALTLCCYLYSALLGAGARNRG